SDTYL
ncbi:hypothetical protein EE612_014766, partial [Oryza sativa]